MQGEKIGLVEVTAKEGLHIAEEPSLEGI